MKFLIALVFSFLVTSMSYSSVPTASQLAYEMDRCTEDLLKYLCTKVYSGEPLHELCARSEFQLEVSARQQGNVYFIFPRGSISSGGNILRIDATRELAERKKYEKPATLIHAVGTKKYPISIASAKNSLDLDLPDGVVPGFFYRFTENAGVYQVLLRVPDNPKQELLDRSTGKASGIILDFSEFVDCLGRNLRFKVISQSTFEGMNMVVSPDASDRDQKGCCGIL